MTELKKFLHEEDPEELEDDNGVRLGVSTKELLDQISLMEDSNWDSATSEAWSKRLRRWLGDNDLSQRRPNQTHYAEDKRQKIAERCRG